MSERTQVKLVLTRRPEVLSALRRVGAMRRDDKDKEYFAAMFNAQEFRFYEGKTIVVPEPVAEGLYKASGVLVNDSPEAAMNDTQQPGIDKLESWELGEMEPSSKRGKTVCSICDVDQGSVGNLKKHILSHTEDEEEDENSNGKEEVKEEKKEDKKHPAFTSNPPETLKRR